jgi:acyl CoA:acetate/3-ketoacid CoA transferase alpha subunit
VVLPVSDPPHSLALDLLTVLTNVIRPETIIAAIHRRGIESLNNLTAVSNNAGASIDGGLSILIRSGQVTNLILSYLGNNKNLEKKYLEGHIGIELCPQGTLAERLRAGGSGVPAFYTPTGARELDLNGTLAKVEILILTTVRRHSHPVRRNSDTPRAG